VTAAAQINAKKCPARRPGKRIFDMQRVSNAGRPRNSRIGLDSIAELQLGENKALRCSIEPVNGRPSVHLRRWRLDPEARAMRPTAEALVVHVSQLAALYSMIGAALASARRQGLVYSPAEIKALEGA
jgi:hypothetical protein